MQNQYVQLLCNMIESGLPIEEKNRIAFILIKTISKIKPLHQVLVEEIGNEVKIEIEEMGLDAAASGVIAIHLAIDKGYDEIISQLLAHGANPNMLDRYHITPLIRAVQKCKLGGSFPEEKQYKIVTLLLENKADINLVNPETKESPLAWAVYHNNLKLVRILLDAGANPNTEETLGGKSPLEYAIKNDNIEMVTALLNAKIPANPNFRNKVTELTALTLAAQRNKDIVELLLAKNADPNSAPGYNGETPLNLSIINGDLLVFDLLRNAKANMNDRALVLAINNKKLYMVSLLLSSLPVLDDKAMGRLTFFLSKECQNDPAIFDCLAILSSHPMYEAIFYKSLNIELYKPEDVKAYLLKLKELQKMYLSYFLLSTNDVFPSVIGTLVCDYLGVYFVAESPIPAIKYLKPETVDPHIFEIQRKIRPGIFQHHPVKDKKEEIEVVSTQSAKKSMWQRFIRR